jgi:hypothetical protein
VRLAVANLFSENNRERLGKEIECVKEALKTPLLTIVASLEGNENTIDREVLHITPYPKLLILGQKILF